MYNHISTQFFDNLIDSLYPIRLGVEEQDWEVEDLKIELETALKSNFGRRLNSSKTVVNAFFELLPLIKSKLDLDVQAIFNGDPAAKSRTEVILTYPGFYAIAAYRISNLLHTLGVELIPRIISEYAHSRTGIDIHPGAEIGEHFCIDHGTGIVIGETALIGNNVKLYQGVTLGALSVESRTQTGKRHPSIGDNVVVYAQATILGGDTIIGTNSIIGGNVWLTESVPENSKVVYQAKVETTLIPKAKRA